MTRRRIASVLAVRGRYVLAVSRGWPPVVWGLPGGRMGDRETFEMAARRELQEETGLEAPKLIPLLEEQDERRVVQTFFAPELYGALESSPEGMAAWVSIKHVLNGPHSLHTRHALKALESFR